MQPGHALYSLQRYEYSYPQWGLVGLRWRQDGYGHLNASNEF